MTSQDESPPPRGPSALNRITAWTSLLIGKAALFTALLATILIAAFYWPDWWPGLRDRFTPHFDGQIIVNSPAVYTRQRLVNDRLAQSAWLQEQLRVTTREFDSAFRSIDEVRSVRSASALRGQVGVKGSGSADGAQGGAASSGAGSLVDEPKGETTVPTIAPTSADLFRAKNTYREEVRAEIMETQLDDRHDIQGNTIYRLSFDATVLPGTRVDGLAVIKVKLLHDATQADSDRPLDRDNALALDLEYFQLYEDWLRFMQKVVQKSVTNIGQTLYERKPDERVAQTLPIFLLKRICEFMNVDRFSGNCDPVIYPDNGTSELKAASRKIAEFTSAYLAARNMILQEHLRLNILSTAKRFNKAPEPFLYALDESLLFCQGLQKYFHKTDWTTGDKLDVACPVVNGPFEGLIGATILYNELFRKLPETPEKALLAMSEVLDLMKGRCPGEKAICSIPDTTRDNLRCLAADYMWSQLNQHDRSSKDNFKFASGFRFDKYFNVQLAGSETGTCNVLFLAKERVRINGKTRAETKEEELDPITLMRRDLNSGVEVYAYSITPKNLAQRLSTATDTRDAIQALLGMNFGAGGRDISSLVETLQKKSTQSQAIQSLPIVVGYGLAPAAAQKPPHTEFGWVIAPQIKIGKQDERMHSDRQYALAAVISVPSWWRSMALAIETCWVDRADLHKQKQGCSIGATENAVARHTVRLPGAISELSRKLGYEFVQEPRLEYRYPEDAPLKLEIGKPAQVLLIGGRIWRSTEVTLGSQKADEIAVLPNMEGILARFRCVRRQFHERGDEEPGKAVVPIRVWTSEGVTDPPEYAVLQEPPNADPKWRADMCPEERQEMQAHTNSKDGEPPR